MRVCSHRTQEGGIVTTWADISALKHRELELADLVTRLKVARDQANDASRTKSTFLANMSHELRTPLNAIIGYSEMLKEEAQDKGTEEFLPDIDRIEAAGRHLLSVINDILDISKIEAGRADIYLEDIDMPALLAEVQSIIRPLAAKNNNRLEVVCPPSTCSATAASSLPAATSWSRYGAPGRRAARPSASGSRTPASA